MADRDAAYYVALAQDLASRAEYAWARETLQGIATTIRQTERLTVKQQEAIEHIMVGRLKHDVRESER
jgi:hypothetical protein